MVTERGREVLYIQTRRKNSAGTREMLRARIDRGEVIEVTAGSGIRYEVLGIIPEIPPGFGALSEELEQLELSLPFRLPQEVLKGAYEPVLVECIPMTAR